MPITLTSDIIISAPLYSIIGTTYYVSDASAVSAYGSADESAYQPDGPADDTAHDPADGLVQCGCSSLQARHPAELSDLIRSWNEGMLCVHGQHLCNCDDREYDQCVLWSIFICRGYIFGQFYISGGCVWICYGGSATNCCGHASLVWWSVLVQYARTVIRLPEWHGSSNG